MPRHQLYVIGYVSVFFFGIWFGSASTVFLDAIIARLYCYQVLVVRNDLKMGKGMIAAQCRTLLVWGGGSHLAIETSDHGALKENHRLDDGASHGSDDVDEDDSEKFIIDFPLRFLSDLEAHFRLKEKPWKSGMNMKTTML
ncbi:hypothetical protein L1987_21451 [Smallanthus sonchifolius]|uniref:Uncharacterized protein n=1 Tax=Smallanthus sonchifolius TaxID=185202 RepID=A0ACB9IXI2_9ASTR|nr:hypothetical protein L1987_21451 [Smallanthus sonchifolius]